MDIVAALADISPVAITKHVNALINAKRVSAEFVGKQHMYKLNIKPIQKLADWLQPYAQQWGTQLTALPQHLGEKMNDPIEN